MIARVVVLIAGLVAGGCGPPPPPPDPHAAHKAQVAAGLTKVRESLKDPGSAQFRKLSLHANDAGTWTAVCGEVNARNSFGGYVGYRRFVQGGMFGVEIETDADRSFASSWDTYCSPSSARFQPQD